MSQLRLLDVKSVKKEYEDFEGPYQIPESLLGRILDAYDETEITLFTPENSRAGYMDIHEMNILVKATKCLDPINIFEIGTFDGLTALNLANNTTARVFTLDLPATDISQAKFLLNKFNVSLVQKPEIGAFIKDDPRIVQLFGDSAQFDYSPYIGSMDMVLVDGCHSYEYCKSDSFKAFQMVRKGGIVFWHDYNKVRDLPGVTSCLHEFARSGKKLYWIRDTSLVLYVNV